jgi:hypothetical protein
LDKREICTDLGKPVRHRNKNFAPILSPIEKQDMINGVAKDYPNVILVKEPTYDYNCHGRTFDSCQSWVDFLPVESAHREIKRILNDGYDSRGKRNNEHARVCDIIVYYDDGYISHMGLVIQVDNSNKATIIQSKWGAYGEYRHHPDGSCYGVDWEIFRRRVQKAHDRDASDLDVAVKKCTENNQLMEKWE